LGKGTGVVFIKGKVDIGAEERSLGVRKRKMELEEGGEEADGGQEWSVY